MMNVKIEPTLVYQLQPDQLIIFRHPQAAKQKILLLLLLLKYY